MRFWKKCSTIKIGRLGETFAIAYLRRQGYVIIEQNYRKRFGELDIVARDREVLVFVEVKTRHSNQYGRPDEAVDSRKQRRLIRTAQDYLLQHRLFDTAARFDVLALTLDQEDRPQEINLIKNAFDCQYGAWGDI